MLLARNSSPELARKLPQVAKELELELYRSAESFRDYRDRRTLEARIWLFSEGRLGGSGGENSNNNSVLDMLMRKQTRLLETISDANLQADALWPHIIASLTDRSFRHDLVYFILRNKPNLLRRRAR